MKIKYIRSPQILNRNYAKTVPHPSIGRRRKRRVLEQEATAGKTTEAGCNSSKPIVAGVAANIGGFKNDSFKKRNIQPATAATQAEKQKEM